MAAVTKRPLLNGVVSRIHRVGVELEGGWTKDPGIPILRDSSVEVVPPSGAKQFYHGEVPTPKGGLELSDIDHWMTAYYPQVVNGTCGMHVHMSLRKKLYYQQLMVPDFTKVIVKCVGEWAEEEKLPKDHPIWDRILRPNHPHCAHDYCGDKQVLMTKKDYNSRGTPHSRYTAINYCHGQYGTLECRLLPMMETPAQGVRAVMKVVDTTNRFLSKVREKELRFGGGVPVRNESIQELRQRIR